MKSISIKNLNFSYRSGKQIFKDLNLQILNDQTRGKIVALMGPSGVGKTTLMKILLGMQKKKSGQIEIVPPDIMTSYVPQEAVLFEHLSPLENAKMFKHTRNLKASFDENIFHEIAAGLDILDVLKSRKKVTELSGGQVQRLSLLRAMSIRPDFLLLDEPCTGLDPEVKRKFLFKLKELASLHDLLVLYVTHHIDEAEIIADEVLYLHSQNELGIIDQVSHLKLSQFMAAPPSLEAARNRFFPGPNILKGEIKNGRFSPSADGIEYILLRAENLVASPKGIFIQKIMESDLYYFFEEAESNQVFSFQKTASLHDLNRFEMVGKVLVYDHLGNFDRIAALKNNDE